MLIIRNTENKGQQPFIGNKSQIINKFIYIHMCRVLATRKKKNNKRKHLKNTTIPKL